MAAKRQSAALLSNISGDQKLMKALIDIEELTTKYETDKQAYENKVSFTNIMIMEENSLCLYIMKMSSLSLQTISCFSLDKCEGEMLDCRKEALNLF